MGPRLMESARKEGRWPPFRPTNGPLFHLTKTGLATEGEMERELDIVVTSPRKSVARRNSRRCGDDTVVAQVRAFAPLRVSWYIADVKVLVVRSQDVLRHYCT